MSFVCRIASAGFHASTAGGRRGGDRTSCVCGAPGPGVTRSCRPWRAACGLGCAVPGAGGAGGRICETVWTACGFRDGLRHIHARRGATETRRVPDCA